MSPYAGFTRQQQKPHTHTHTHKRDARAVTQVAYQKRHRQGFGKGSEAQELSDLELERLRNRAFRDGGAASHASLPVARLARVPAVTRRCQRRERRTGPLTYDLFIYLSIYIYIYIYIRTHTHTQIYMRASRRRQRQR